MRSSLFSLLAAQGVTLPASEGYVSTDFPTIAGFFLGWIFFYAVQCMSQSPFITELLSRTARTARPTSAATQPVRDVEKQPRLTRYDGPTEAEADAADYILRGDNPTVLFGMYLCFAMASAANFGSLVTFNPVNGDAACAFVVAWGSMSTELAKIVALYIISLQLKHLAVDKRELYVFWLGLLAIAALMLATTAVATGFVGTSPIGLVYCNKKHFLPTSIAASLVQFFLAFYAVVRLVSRLTSPEYNVPGRTSSLRDIRILQALAFTLLVLLTLVPMAVATDVLGDCVPFAIGSIPVLATFSHRAQPLDDTERHPSGHTVERAFSARRGRDPALLGVYIPSSASLRGSPVSAHPDVNLSNHPYATAAFGRASSRSSGRSAGFRVLDIQSSVGSDRGDDASRGSVTPPVTFTALPPPPPLPTDPNAQWPAGLSRKILSSQVTYAQELEREDEARAQALALGPVPPPARPMRPRVQIPETRRSGGNLLAPDVSRRTSTSAATPNSAAVYGSDIVRLTPGRAIDRMRQYTAWSPPDTSAPALQGRERRRSAQSPADALGSMRSVGTSDELSPRSRFGTPPRRRQTIASQTSDDSFFAPMAPAPRTNGPRWARAPVAGAFPPVPQLSSAFVSVTSPSGETVVDAASPPATGAPRVSWIRGPRPPPAVYQPTGPRYRSGQALILGSVREETPTPTRNMT